MILKVTLAFHQNDLMLRIDLNWVDVKKHDQKFRPIEMQWQMKMQSTCGVIEANFELIEHSSAKGNFYE